LAVLGAWGVLYAAADGAWGPALSALLGTLFGIWLFHVAVFGTLSGRRPSNPDTLPNEEL